MDIVTEEEKQALRSILTSFYGSQTLRWGVTQRSFELFGELISKTKQCDIAMNWVPRPFYIGNSLNWAKKQVRQAIVRESVRGAEWPIFLPRLQNGKINYELEFYRYSKTNLSRR